MIFREIVKMSRFKFACYFKCRGDERADIDFSYLLLGQAGPSGPGFPAVEKYKDVVFFSPVRDTRKNNQECPCQRCPRWNYSCRTSHTYGHQDK